MSFKKKLGFKCAYCHRWVDCSRYIGTHFRNHCPYCLYSKHVDEKKPGDRKSFCHGLMKPIGLTFKKEGFDKYGKPRQGELMVVHQCQDCGEISINRLAADDSPQVVLKIFEDSQKLPLDLVKEIENQGIKLLTKKDEEEIKTQLFGKNNIL